MKMVLESSDYAEIREMCQGNVDFVPTDAQIDQVCRADAYAVAVAHDWGWDDTEVRDRLCTALEELVARDGPAGGAARFAPMDDVVALDGVRAGVLREAGMAGAQVLQASARADQARQAVEACRAVAVFLRNYPTDPGQWPSPRSSGAPRHRPDAARRGGDTVTLHLAGGSATWRPRCYCLSVQMFETRWRRPQP